MRSTQKPLVALWKVTRSIEPASTSEGCPSLGCCLRSAGLAIGLVLCIALLFDAVGLPLIRAAQVGVVTLQHRMGRVVGVEQLACNGIGEAVVTDDAVPGYRG
jgi:hypothetical protein